MREITHIVLHTAASAVRVFDGRSTRPKVVHQSFETVRDYHVVNNGWRDIGYHYYITEHGQIHIGRPESEKGAHVSGFNDTTIGICVSGHGDFEGWYEEQLKAVIALCSRICKDYNFDEQDVLGHRECSTLSSRQITKTCPGNLVSMTDIRCMVRHELKKQKTVLMEAVKPEGEMVKSLEERVQVLEKSIKDLTEKFNSKTSLGTGTIVGTVDDPSEGTVMFNVEDWKASST